MFDTALMLYAMAASRRAIDRPRDGGRAFATPSSPGTSQGLGAISEPRRTPSISSPAGGHLRADTIHLRFRMHLSEVSGARPVVCGIGLVHVRFRRCRGPL